MTKPRRLLRLLLVAACLAAAGSARAVTELDEARLFPDINQKYQIFEDKSASLGIDAVRHLPESAWRLVPGFAVAGAAGVPTWTRLAVRNGTTGVSSWALTHFLSFGHSRSEVYLVREGGKIIHAVTGKDVPLIERSLPARALGFVFELPPSQGAELFVRTESRTGIRQDLTIQPVGTFWVAHMAETIFLGLFMATLAFAAFGGLLFGVRFRDSANAHYVVYGLAVLVETLLWYGFTPQLPGISAGTIVVLERVATGAAVVAGALFSRALFRLPERSKVLNVAFLLVPLSICTAFMLNVSAATEGLSHKLLYYTLNYTAALQIVCGLWALRRRLEYASVFLICRFFASTSVYVWVLAQFGYFAHGFHTLYATAIGQILEIFLMGGVLVLRARTDERSRVAAETKARTADRLAMLLRVTSHDVANVVQSIDICAQLGLRQPALAAANLQRIQSANGVAREQIRHVRSMLTFIDEGKSILAPVDLGDVVADVQRVFVPIAEVKGVGLEIETAAFAGVSVLGDRTAIGTSILGNLVANAIKFSARGDVVRLRLARDRENVRIQVLDRGIGIPAALVPTLFDLGSAKSRTGTAGESGNGFGMPVVKAYVESFGGKIEVLSRTIDAAPKDHGTTMTVTLRAAQV